MKTEVCDRINRVFFGLSPLLWRPVLIRLEHQVILLAPRSSSVPSLGFRWNEEQYRQNPLDPFGNFLPGPATSTKFRFLRGNSICKTMEQEQLEFGKRKNYSYRIN